MDYKIWYDQGTNIYKELVVVTETSYTAEGLTPGNTYKIKLQSRNSVGYSPFSNEISILASQVPSQPEAPSTITSGYENVIVIFTAPYNGGSPVSSYKITLRQSDGVTFSEELTYCDGSDSVIKSSKRCEIPFTVFKAEPFNLDWGSSIYAKVSATNIMGESQTSSSGNGAVITRIPDPPINLMSDAAQSNAV